MYDVCIVGGGASGMVCAINAAERGRSVCIVEKNQAPGKKIFATGNGRCNITNSNCKNASDVMAFFRSLGLETKTEDEGRVYPLSSQAADVVFVLKNRLHELKVDIICGRPVDWVEVVTGSLVNDRKKNFDIYCESEKISCSSLVLACGGKAAPGFGTTGDGYSLARQLGHSIVKPVPVLTAIETEESLMHLKGVRTGAVCSLIKKGEIVFSEAGEVQFTDYGLSGICVFNMSRHLLLDQETAFSDYEISLDFSALIESSKEMTMVDIIRERSKVRGFKKNDILRTILPQPLAVDIVRRSGIVGKEPAIELDDAQIHKISEMMGAWKQTVKGAKGWKMAQCTKGGVLLNEIDQTTMQSMITPGLYVVGELLDIDGPCGGYNLQNAWETGIKAGKNV